MLQIKSCCINVACAIHFWFQCVLNVSIEHGLNYDQWIGGVVKWLRAKWMKTCGANWRIMVEIQILRSTMCSELRFAFGTQ